MGTSAGSGGTSGPATPAGAGGAAPPVGAGGAAVPAGAGGTNGTTGAGGNPIHTQKVSGRRADAGDPANAEADDYIERRKAEKRERLEAERAAAKAGATDGEGATPAATKRGKK